MNTSEMHVWFRQYAQQMGMQNVRAILPEQIDLFINTSIDDTVAELIRTNVGITNDRVITDNSKIGQINALRSLYKVIEVNATCANSILAGPGSSTVENPFYYQGNKRVCRMTANIRNFTDTSGQVEIKPGEFKYRFLVDTSIKYTRDNKLEKDQNDPFDSEYFPIRIVDDAYLSDAINDFILKPRLRTPIAVVYNDTYDLYVGDLHRFEEPIWEKDADGRPIKITGYETYYFMDQHLIPDKIRVSYIAEPTKVGYFEDIGGVNQECDLPEYMHVDILKHAVDLYRISINGSLQASQQQADNQKRENTRNQYRDEGYQQQQ